MRCYEIYEILPRGQTDPNAAAADPWFAVQQQASAPAMNRETLGTFLGEDFQGLGQQRPGGLFGYGDVWFSALIDRSKTITSTNSTNMVPDFK